MLRTLFKILFWSFITWLVLRTFVFQAFRIPSSSMYGSIFENDYVLIDKLAYGPRLPMTPLALPLSDTKKYIDWISLPYFRLFGYSSIQRNDVLAFNYELTGNTPVDMQEEFIKRCVALPGDTLKITAGNVYANNKPIENPFIYNTYKVSSEQLPDTVLLKRAGIITESVSGDGKTYTCLMSAATADSLSKLKTIRAVTQDRIAADYYAPTAYPNVAEFKWNYDHFGPLWIPKKGDSVALTKSNLVLYQRCMEVYEKQKMSFKQDTVLIDGKPVTHYCFKQNYYFVLGDNRHNSIDSRVMGLIPEDHIIGRAGFILFSSSPARKFSTIR